MTALEKRSGHPRLYRRGAVYYHRASIPEDIALSYPKSEETFSLGTKDRREAVKLVRIVAAEIDQRFEDHRRSIVLQDYPTVEELIPEQIQDIKTAYFQHLLEEDEESRLRGFRALSIPKLSE